MEKIKKVFKFINKHGEVLYDELGKRAKAEKEAEDIVKTIDGFNTSSKTNDNKGDNQPRQLNGEIIDSDDDANSDIADLLNKVIESFKGGPLKWTPQMETHLDNTCDIGGDVSHCTREFEIGDNCTLDREHFFEAEGKLQAKGKGGMSLSLTHTNNAKADYEFDLKGKAGVSGEALSDKLSTQNGKERHIKVAEATASAELKGKARASAELNALTWNHKMQVHAEVDATGRAKFAGADIKTTSNDDGFKANFKIGHADADFKCELKAGASAGSKNAKMKANAEGSIDLSLVEGDFSHQSKCDIRKVSPDNEQKEGSTWEKGIEINAEAKTNGHIKFGRGKGNLNYSLSKDEPSSKPKGKSHSFDVTLADLEFAQQSKCAIKGKASYDKLKTEKKNEWKRETKMHAKAEGSIDAKSEGYAKVNILEKEVAKIEYNAKLEGDGKADFKGREKTQINTPDGYEKQFKVCTGSMEGKFKGEAGLSAEMNILKCKTKIGAEGKLEGNAKAEFILAETKTIRKNGRTTREFRLIEGKAECKGKAEAKAYLGKHSVGFDAEAEGKAKLCVAKGNADFNVRKTKKGYNVSGLNLTVGKASAKGRAKCNINASINNKKHERKFDVSREAKVKGIDIKAFNVDIRRDNDCGNQAKVSAEGTLAKVNLMNLKATGKETGHTMEVKKEFKGLEANIGNVQATGIDDRKNVNISSSTGLTANIGNVQATGLGPKGVKMEHDSGAGIDCFNLAIGTHRTTGVSIASNRAQFCNVNLTIGPPQLNINTGPSGFNFGIPFLSSGGGGGGGNEGGTCDSENEEEIKDDSKVARTANSRKVDVRKDKENGRDRRKSVSGSGNDGSVDDGRGSSGDGTVIGGDGTGCGGAGKGDYGAGNGSTDCDGDGTGNGSTGKGGNVIAYGSADGDGIGYGSSCSDSDEIGYGSTGNRGDSYDSTESNDDGTGNDSSGGHGDDIGHGSTGSSGYRFGHVSRGYSGDVASNGGEIDYGSPDWGGDGFSYASTEDGDGIGCSSDSDDYEIGYDNPDSVGNGIPNSSAGSHVYGFGNENLCGGDGDTIVYDRRGSYTDEIGYSSIGRGDADGCQSEALQNETYFNLTDPEEYNKYIKSLVDERLQKGSKNKLRGKPSKKCSGNRYWANTEQVRSDIFKEYTGKTADEIQGIIPAKESRQHQVENMETKRNVKQEAEPKKPFGSNKNIHTIFTLCDGDSKPIHYLKDNIACFGDD